MCLYLLYEWYICIYFIYDIYHAYVIKKEWNVVRDIDVLKLLLIIIGTMIDLEINLRLTIKRGK